MARASLAILLECFRQDLRRGSKPNPKQRESAPREGYTIGIDGVSRCQPAIGRARAGDPVFLRHEPDNGFDHRAIAVMSRGGEKLGYLTRNGWMTRVLLDEQKAASACILSIEQLGRVPHLAVVLLVTIA